MIILGIQANDPPLTRSLADPGDTKLIMGFANLTLAATNAELLLQTMQPHPLGQNASIIGTVFDDPHHFVPMKTRFGGRRIVDWLAGDQLPRIC